MSSRWIVALATCAVAACSTPGNTDTDARSDTSTADGRADVGLPDLGMTPDVGLPDLGTTADVGLPDLGMTADGGLPDLGTPMDVPDAIAPDAPPPRDGGSDAPVATDATDVPVGVDVRIDSATDTGPVCVDSDRDTYGAGCAAGADCNDTDPAVHPGATEICGDRVDNNCDGRVDEGCPCGVLTVACAAGCCAVPAVELAPIGIAPAVAIDAAGYIFVAYSIPAASVRGAGFATFNPTTSTWSTANVGRGGYASRVIVSASGRLHHLFGGDAAAYIYRFSDNHGATWTTRTVSATAAIGGTSDLAIGAGDAPHVVYQGPGAGVWPELDYVVWSGAAWTLTRLDTATTQDDHPAIALGFADRPHVFAQAYHPDGVITNSARHAFFDGARWVYENIEMGAGVYADASEPYAAMRGEVFPDDTVRVVYSRTRAGVVDLVRADRASGTTGAWTLTTVPGVTMPFRNAQYVDTVAGAPAVVADGLTVYRRNVAGTFVASAPTLLGTQPGYAVRGNTLFIAYMSNEPSTRGRMYFTRVDY